MVLQQPHSGPRTYVVIIRHPVNSINVLINTPGAASSGHVSWPLRRWYQIPACQNAFAPSWSAVRESELSPLTLNFYFYRRYIITHTQLIEHISMYIIIIKWFYYYYSITVYIIKYIYILLYYGIHTRTIYQLRQSHKRFRGGLLGRSSAAPRCSPLPRARERHLR